MAIYPTKEKIMAPHTPQFTAEDIETVKNWKKLYFKGWSKLDLGVKITALKHLIHLLSPNVYTVSGETYCYIPNHQPLIMLDTENPSILSTLHEIGHARYGSSELKACRFSVWLFKICFPRSFEQLSWDGHMLKKT
jgi:hypothetical protein